MSSQLQFASIMVPGNQAYWWYYGQTGEQVGQLLTQNKAMLTSINAYIDTDATLTFAVVMEPPTKAYWWYSGQTAEQVGQLMTQNKAMPTDISAYVDVDNTLKFAVIMTPNVAVITRAGTHATAEWWWYYGQTAER